MGEPVRSVMLAGRGLLRWPGGEERVNYRVTVGLDTTIGAIHIGTFAGYFAPPRSSQPQFFTHARRSENRT